MFRRGSLRQPSRNVSLVDGVMQAGLSDEPAFERDGVIHIRVGSTIKPLRR